MSNPLVLYPAEGISTLLGRAWTMVRLTLKTSVQTMMWPSLWHLTALIVLSIPGNQSFLSPLSGLDQTKKLLAFAVGLTLLGISLLAWLSASCTLVRFYYGLLTESEPPSIEACRQWIQQNRLGILKLGPMIGALALSCMVTDVFLIFMLSTLYLNLLVGLGGKDTILGSMPMMLIGLLSTILWGSISMSSMLTLVTLQILGCVFPFVAVVTAASQPVNVIQMIGYTWKLLLAQSPRAVVFMVAMFLFASALSTALNGPIYLWAFFEKNRLGIHPAGGFPFYIHGLMNLWLSLVNLLLMPYYISAITLFWYDCQVRREGLDLQLWLRQLIKRNSPEQNANV